jgi:hypothetical protein
VCSIAAVQLNTLINATTPNDIHCNNEGMLKARHTDDCEDLFQRIAKTDKFPEPIYKCLTAGGEDGGPYFAYRSATYCLAAIFGVNNKLMQAASATTTTATTNALSTTTGTDTTTMSTTATTQSNATNATNSTITDANASKQSKPRRGGGIVIGIMIVLLVLVVGGAWFWRKRDHTERAEMRYGARFRRKVPLEDTIGSHTCSLEALACVRPIAVLSGVCSSYQLAL